MHPEHTQCVYSPFALHNYDAFNSIFKIKFTMQIYARDLNKIAGLNSQNKYNIARSNKIMLFDIKI